MRRDEHLAPFSSGPALFSKFQQQPGMEVILRLFDSDEAGRFGIIENDQVSQHLQGSVRDPTRRYRLPEGGVFQLQEEAAIVQRTGADLLQLGNTRSQDRN